MANFNIDYLVVAGGGSGGGFGGGGGAGGLLTNVGGDSLVLAHSIDYSLTVGAGGIIIPYATSPYADYTPGQQGGSSSFSGTDVSTITAVGGGGGNSYSVNAASPGGSGGGGSTGRSTGSIIGNPGTSGQGNSGGNGLTYQSAGNAYGSGGAGGGAGAIGGNGFLSAGVSRGGTGGIGVTNSITVSSGDGPYYAGGGGGFNYPSGTSSGGLGGGGYGGNYDGGAGLAAESGADNSGGGGGGGYGYLSATVGAGGSGVVILRYATSDIDSYTATGLTPVETIVGTDTVLSFTTVGTGTITFTAPPPPPKLPFDGTKVTAPVTGFDKTNTTQGLKLPSGTNINQPAGVSAIQGMIRNDIEETVDSSASALTHYNGTAWQYFAATESPDFEPLTVDYLVVAGGGGGGNYFYGGGGGAGGMLTSFGSGNISGGNQQAAETITTAVKGVNYEVTVGLGGSATNSGGNSELNMTPARASVLTTGGGYGGSSAAGGPGGSGGGASRSGTHAGGARTSNPIQGFAGATSTSGTYYAAGGGGGASATGLSSGSNSAIVGKGGDGIESSITGVNIYYAGGGAGAMNAAVAYPDTPQGGAGGGGNGGTYTNGSNLPPTAGTNGLGGGGGGGCHNGNGTGTGASGGSGVVILRYPSDYDINFQTGVGFVSSTVTLLATSEKVTTITAGSGTITFVTI